MNPMTTEPAVTSTAELWITLLKTFGMLGLVLAILIGVLWILRKAYHRSGGGTSGLIQIVASSYMGPKERIVLVNVLGEKYLLGVTSQQINLLARISDEKDISSPPPLPSESIFKSMLRRNLNGRSKSDKKKDPDIPEQ